jgi:hypothetical protein
MMAAEAGRLTSREDRWSPGDREVQDIQGQRDDGAPVVVAAAAAKPLEDFEEPEDLLIQIAAKLTVALRILEPIGDGGGADLLDDERGWDLNVIQDLLEDLRQEARNTLRGLRERRKPREVAA